MSHKRSRCYRWMVLVGGMFVLSAQAKIFYTGAPTYPIAEQDVRQTVQAILATKIANGEWAQWHAQQIVAAQMAADRPAPVVGITTATATRSWLFHPTVTMAATPGANTVNPLDNVTWTTTLIFYDGDNPKQVQWAQQVSRQTKAKAILVNGSVREQMQQLEQRVFFDQGGRLVNQFNIQHVPARVEQEGNLLRITEIKL